MFLVKNKSLPYKSPRLSIKNFILQYSLNEMAGFGYGGFGTPFGGNMQQTFEQERVGFGPQGYVVFVVSNEFIFNLLQIWNLRTGDAGESKSIHWSNVYCTRKRIYPYGWCWCWWIYGIRRIWSWLRQSILLNN